MFCDKCGAKLSAGAQTCPSCGKTFVSFMPPKRGIAGHVRLLGILWLANAALYAGPGMFLMALFSARFFPPDVPPFVAGLLPWIGNMLLFAGVLSAIVGVGLLLRSPWARIAALIAAALNLLNLPLGTALGVYTLWALLPADHEEEYRALSRVA